MSNGYGQSTYGASGGGAVLSTNGSPERIVGGGTIDWGSVPAAGVGGVTLVDGQVIPEGTKYIPFGTIMAKITQAEVQTITITGAPTGGTFTLTLTRNGVARTTAAIPFDATAAAVAAALEALDNVGAGNVTATGGALPGAAVTVTFYAGFGNVGPMGTSSASLTGGTTPAVAVATTTEGVAGGSMFGPHQSGVTDGRQTLTKGAAFVLNATITEDDPESLYGPGFIEGGPIYQSRLKRLNDAGTAYIAHAVDATFNLAFPRFRLAEH